MLRSYKVPIASKLSNKETLEGGFKKDDKILREKGASSCQNICALIHLPIAMLNPDLMNSLQAFLAISHDDLIAIHAQTPLLVNSEPCRV